ncbi:MAG: hypothetical protein EAZ27_10875 [Cytophagales bacterium]|nr:MAG: hypothetical protein EAZ27_10875 [Cytophagales bacterium]
MKITFILVLCQFLVFSQTGEPKLILKEWRKGISLAVPEKFLLMSDDDMAQKYPSYRKPIGVYSDKKTDISINYSINKWNNKNLDILKSMYKATISSVFTDVEFIQDGVIKKVNDRDFIVFEFISNLVEENGPKKGASLKTYSYLAYTLYKNKVLILNMNTQVQERNDWANTFGKIFESFVITDKLQLDVFKPYEAENKQMPKGGQEDVQMKLLKKMGKSRTKNPQ